MKKLLITLVSFMFVISCANIKDTVVPVTGLSLSHGLKGVRIYTEPCDASSAELKVSHYQGILRVPQFSGLGGLPNKDRDVVKQLSIQIAQYNFLSQIEKAGAEIRKYEGDEYMEKDSVRLKCAISRIWVGIYDNGFGGYGSAGDFWAAETEYDGTVLRNGSEYPMSHIKTRGEVKHAPVNPGNFLELLKISAKMSSAAVSGNIPGVVSSVGGIDYHMKTDVKSPVEAAAGLAGQDAAAQIYDIMKK
ncbi:MAG: hypothetical protein AB7E96_07900 [Deferribacterales bacterium]